MDKVESLVREVAAGVILPRFRGLQRHEIEEKTPGELVTAVDREAERILTAGLLTLKPGSIVVGEEACAAAPELMRRIADDEDVWLVDPLDGTANFAAGREPFAVMVALVRKRETVAAWMLDPVGGAMARAERGGGAFVGEERVKACLNCPPLAALCGAIHKRFMRPEDRVAVERRENALAAVLPGFMCAGREYPAVVAGELHFTVFQRLLPWDHAPGVLFVEEAGGTARRLDGSAYVPGDLRPGLLVAQNGYIWRLVRDSVLADLT